MSEPVSPSPPPPAPKRKNHLWIAYFAFLLIASVGVAAFMIWFNLRVQLKPEELEAAREHWKAHGPKNYNMIYTKELASLGTTDKFAVKVRGGRVTEVMMNDKPLEWKKDEGQTDDPRLYHSMDAIFRDMQRFMDIDQKPGAMKVYCVANFEPKTGAVIRYIRSVRGTVDRVDRIELKIALTPIEQ